MHYVTKSLLLVAVLGLAACSNANRFGSGSGTGAGFGDGGYGAGGFGSVDTAGLGSASDPTSAAYFQQTVGDRVFFAVDQSTLSPEARDTLGQQARWLTTNRDYQIIIEGHADEQGTREYNLALGARRASSVQEFLISQGISPNRMRTVSYGKERPVEVCSNEACYSRNRRAVTVISSGIGS
ncbi:peptidoglycan-associated lipoprotein Pal [Plastorhodobacter daqingensis]|uniref:Peptidoglycan-associated lipoprotein n=1 Tax=Plastorhodobacter daqingensis TaxID=1387281 RepID=A0ABW2UN19_9RHOB